MQEIKKKVLPYQKGSQDEWKYQPTYSTNVPTVICFLLTVVLSLYTNLDNIKSTLDTSHSKSIRKPYVSSTTQTLIIERHANNKIHQTQIISNVSQSHHSKSSSKNKRNKKHSITNDYDKLILHQLNEGEQYYRQNQFPECVSFFEKLLKKYSKSPRAVYGQARCLDKLAEKLKSNEFLKNAITAYGNVVNQPNVPTQLLKVALITQSQKYVFLGKPRKASLVLRELAKRLPKDVAILNELGTTYMILGANNQAKSVFEEVLEMDPNNGIATIHIGYILKLNLQYEQAIPYLLDGVRSGEKGTDNPRFYIHLGDAFTKLGKRYQAWKIYHEAAEKGIFLSAEQRSPYNAETKLRSLPWWDIEETGYSKEMKLLEYHWKTIRDEALMLLRENKNVFPKENEGLLDSGDWRQFELYVAGEKIQKNCLKVPKTCAIIDKLPNAKKNQRGQIKYSIMEPGTHVWPHTGPTNCRLRAHLGLVIPKDVFIRVGSETRAWSNGKLLVFDDSFDHEVWHNGTRPRMVFIIDFWHPDIPQWEKENLSAI